MRLLRGGSWEALPREIVWQVARATGVHFADLEWLIGLVEARLALRVDGLEAATDRACRSGRAEHARRWPRDLAGSETAAVFDGAEEAAQILGHMYVEVLEWATRLLDERMASATRGSSRRRLPAPRPEREPADVELPLVVAEEVARVRERFGWVRRRAA